MIPTSLGFWVMMALIVFGTLIILSIMASLYRKVGPYPWAYVCVCRRVLPTRYLFPS